MKYILYFGGYDNDVYFYKSLDEMLKDWNCKTLKDLIEEYKGSRYGIKILKIEEVIFESQV